MREEPARRFSFFAGGAFVYVSNAERAREIALPFDYVVFSASKARLFVRGLEAYVVANEMTRLKDIAGGLHCETDAATRRAFLWDAEHRVRAKDPHGWYFDALRASAGDCRPAFSNHEGFFLPAPLLLRFADWARATTATIRGNASSVLDHAASVVGALGGNGVEELYLQSYIATRERDALNRTGAALCEHWPPRQRRVGVFDALSYRLGRNMSRLLAPLEIKRWAGDDREDRVLECWAREDRGGAPDDSARAARSTLRCLRAAHLGHMLPKKNMTGGMDRGRRAAFSVLGADDPFPDAARTAAAVRAFFGFDERAETPG